MIKKIKLIIILLFAASTSFAAKFTVEAPRVVTVGETFRIGFKVDAEPDRFVPPSLDGLRIIAGPTPSVSKLNINGVKSETYTFTYFVEALSEGIVNIPVTEIVVSGTTLKTAAFPIEVIKEKAQAQQPTQGQQQPQAQQPTQSGIGSGDLFLRVEFNKSNPYRGEALVASLKLYTRVGVMDIYNFKAPTFAGLYAQELDVPASESGFKRENVNDKVYNVAVLKRWLFFPQRSGQIKIEPAELTAQVKVQRAQQARSIFDDFFGSPEDILNKELKSPAVNINVKNLPAGAPASFSGAVGNFTFDAIFDKTEIMANEALGYVIAISGTGNLKLAEVPQINLPSDFEKYDPKITEKINSTYQGTSGSKKFEYAIIPRSPGNFEIPELKYSYFNPSTGKYVELTSKAVNITVTKDPNAATAAITNPSGPVLQGQRDIRHLGTDILFIKTTPLKLQPVGYLFFGSSDFWMIMLVLLLVAIIAFFVIRNIEKTRGDVALMRNKRANKVAKKRLKLSEKLMKEGNKQGFYEELSKATWGYVSDKFNMPLSDLSRNNVQDQLHTRGVASEVIDEFISMIDQCEYARYAPDSTGGMESLYSKAIDVISKVER